MIPQINDCKPGLYPTGYNVLVALEVTEEVTVGGIILPGKHVERENSSSERGRIVAVSAMAFRGGDWEGVDAPKSGDVVLFQRYAGTEMTGDDGNKYRVIEDKDIRGVFN